MKIIFESAEFPEFPNFYIYSTFNPPTRYTKYRVHVRARYLTTNNTNASRFPGFAVSSFVLERKTDVKKRKKTWLRTCMHIHDAVCTLIRMSRMLRGREKNNATTRHRRTVRLLPFNGDNYSHK